MNTLYYGDNLDVLRQHIPEESVDLIYLDPPFNSKADYNVLFSDRDGGKSSAQLQAFKDTWKWEEAASVYAELSLLQGSLGDVTRAFGQLLPRGGLLAYLVMMAPRLAELHRVLKPTGSIYLHCDPNASHYLKVLMDAIFGPENFQNEIVWRRTGSHNKVKRYGPIHDIILFYTMSNTYIWNYPKGQYMKGHIERYFVKDEHGYRTNYYGNVLTGSGTRGGDSGKPWKGFDPTAKGRHWAIPGALLADLDEDISHLSQHAKLDYLFDHGYITITPGEAWPIYQRYLGPNDGQPMSDIWAYQPHTDGTVFGTEDGIDADVKWLSPQDKERLGYPTQKPLCLLERIIRASSNPGDMVLDPFCGCGTAIAAAQELDRRWIGIDITQAAIRTIRARLSTTLQEDCDYRVIGEPTSVADAEELAKSDPYQFQWWSLGLVGARPAEERKGSDRGIDGRLFFRDTLDDGEPKQVILSVKAGDTGVRYVRDLRGVLDRENAQIGVLITMEAPTSPMRAEAGSAGLYEAWGQSYPRLQLLTVAELLAGAKIDMPPVSQSNVTFKKAPRSRRKTAAQGELF